MKHDLGAALDAAIDAAGGIQALSRALRCPDQTVRYWQRQSRRVPAERVPAVSAATGLTPHQLRPDLYDAPTRAGRRAAP